MKKELSYWPYKATMIAGAIFIVFGLVLFSVGKAVNHDILGALIVIAGILMLLLGKHLEKEQRIVFLLETYLSAINKQLKPNDGANNTSVKEEGRINILL